MPMFYLLLMTFVNRRRFYVQRKRADVWALLSSAGSRFFLTHDIGNRVQQRFRVRIDVKISAVSRAITNAPPQGNYGSLASFTECFDDLLFLFTGNGVAKDENVETALLTLFKARLQIRCRNYFVPIAFEQHVPGSQQGQVVGNRKDACLGSACS